MESEKVKDIKNWLENESEVYRNEICYNASVYINELESENETLRNAKVVHENVDYCYEDLKKAEKRIAELEKGNEALSFAVKQGFNDCQARTLKQFAERLKEKADGLCIKNDILYAIKSSDIDETLKEFL